MFVDRVQIQVQAGKGGDGCISFRREKFVPRGGPDGGDGGDGGSIVIVAQSGVNSLAALAHQKHWKAHSGDPGRGANCHGRSAEDLIIAVPPGTIIMDTRGGYVLKDLTLDGEQVIAARGGKGGKGNTRFKSSTNRAPRQNTPGEDGEARELVLELKVIADVGVIGKPNAGKSTLLSRVSRARPEIADYPFTTKYPNLGLVQINADRSFVMADIPGLIEGAHEGVGLGHEFLRHIERAGILVHLVEPEPTDGVGSAEQLPCDPPRTRILRRQARPAARDPGRLQGRIAGGAEIQRQLKESQGTMCWQFRPSRGPGSTSCCTPSPTNWTRGTDAAGTP